MCLAVPGEIIEITEADPLARQAKVNFGGLVKPVSLALLPEACAGEYVLVHAGVAISVVDADEAEKTLEYLREIDELNELEDGASP